MRGSAFVTVRVDFDGEYYLPNERTEMVREWIDRTLYDRDDVAYWRFEGDDHVSAHGFRNVVGLHALNYGACDECGLLENHFVHQEDADE